MYRESLAEYDNSFTAFLFLALTIFESERIKVKYNKISELLYLLSIKDVLSLVNAFGGQFIRIPTKKQLDKNMLVVSYYYASTVLKVSNEEFALMFNLSDRRMMSLQLQCNKWIRYLKQNDIVIPKVLMKSNTKLLRTLHKLIASPVHRYDYYPNRKRGIYAEKKVSDSKK